MYVCWVLSRFISYLDPGDSEVVKRIEDGVVSGGFEIAGSSIARRCGDIGVRGIKSDNKVKIAHSSATDVIWTPVEYMGSGISNAQGES